MTGSVPASQRETPIDMTQKPSSSGVPSTPRIATLPGSLAQGAPRSGNGDWTRVRDVPHLEGRSCPEEIAEAAARYLGQISSCFAAGMLTVEGHCGHIVLVRSRPVDDLFLQAVQRRLLLSYQLCVGLASAKPKVQVTIRGDPVSGPYEPPRSLLTMPVLCGGHVFGMMVIASVFPDAFSCGDLCAMAAVAAQISKALHPLVSARAAGSTAPGVSIPQPHSPAADSTAVFP